MTSSGTSQGFRTEFQTKVLSLTECRYRLFPLLDKCIRPGEASNIGNEMSLVLKAHLLAETILDNLIELGFGSNAPAVLSARLSFSKKLQIVSRAYLVDDFELLSEEAVGSMRKLNKMRNKLAHEFGTTVSLEEVKALFMGSEEEVLLGREESKELLLWQYAGFIFGISLPKYEMEEPEDEDTDLDIEQRNHMREKPHE